MNRKVVVVCASLLAALFIVPESVAQITSVVPFRKSQKWTRPAASHASRVLSCQDPRPLPEVVLDDWLCPRTGPVKRIIWWGTVTDPAQTRRPYYIAIYSDNGNCEPANRLYFECVIPKARPVGQDCQGRVVWRFGAAFSGAFTQTQGTRYWLQISEADEESVNPNVPDFQWSAHRPIVGCSAIRRDAAGTNTTPLLDPCDGQPDDMAFELWAQAITGVIVFPADLAAIPIMRFEMYDPTTGALVGSEVIEPTPDPTAPESAAPDSFFDIFTDAGECRYRVVGMGMEPLEGLVTVNPGEETAIGPLTPVAGDLNADCDRNVLDLLMLLGGWGDCTP